MATITTLASTDSGATSRTTINTNFTNLNNAIPAGTIVDTSTVQTLANKVLSDSTTSIVDVADATKAIKFDVTGTTAITGTIQTAFTTAKTVSIPDATDTLVGKATTDTLTNKRKTPRVYTAANNASLTPEIDTYDVFHLTAMSANTTINNHSTSTPTDGEQIRIRFLDNGTARTLTWGSAYVAKGGIALPSTTVLSKNLELGFEYNSNLAKWNLLASAQEA